MKKIVIVAPTFNEQESIAAFIQSVLAQQQNITDYDLHLLISDSHSSDKTSKIVTKLILNNDHVHFLDTKISGPGKLGMGLSMGLDYAVEKLQADILITMEADLSNDPSQIPQFVAKLKDFDLVIGSRYVSGGKIVNWSWWRKSFSLGANNLLRLLAFTTKTHEFTNLYRAFNKNVWLTLRPLVQNRVGWLFVPAFVFEALGTNLKIAEQPIVYFDRFGGRSKMSTLSYTKNLLEYAIQYRLQKSASVFKFGVVGGLGFLVNTIVLVIGVNFGLRPSSAGVIGAELAILVGFFLNNRWTFAEDKIATFRQFLPKFVQYNVIAFGSVVIQFIFLRTGEFFFGLVRFKEPIINFPIIRFYSWYMFFYMAGVGVGMVWNYIMYRKVVWAKKSGSS